MMLRNAALGEEQHAELSADAISGFATEHSPDAIPEWLKQMDERIRSQAAGYAIAHLAARSKYFYLVFVPMGLISVATGLIPSIAREVKGLKPYQDVLTTFIGALHACVISISAYWDLRGEAEQHRQTSIAYKDLEHKIAQAKIEMKGGVFDGEMGEKTRHDLMEMEANIETRKPNLSQGVRKSILKDLTSSTGMHLFQGLHRHERRSGQTGDPHEPVQRLPGYADLESQEHSVLSDARHAADGELGRVVGVGQAAVPELPARGPADALPGAVET